MIAAPEPNLATWRSGNSKRHAQAGSPPPLRYPGARRGAGGHGRRAGRRNLTGRLRSRSVADQGAVREVANTGGRPMVSKRPRTGGS